VGLLNLALLLGLPVAIVIASLVLARAPRGEDAARRDEASRPDDADRPVGADRGSA